MADSVKPVKVAKPRPKTTPKSEAKAKPKPKPKPKPKKTTPKQKKSTPKQKSRSKPKPGSKRKSSLSMVQAAATKARAAANHLHWRTPGGRAAKAMLRTLALLLLVLSIFELLRITLVPTPGSVTFTHPNMHPFATIRLYLREGTVEEQVFQIGGNIALGFILGFLLPQITPVLRGLIRVEIVTVLFVAGIELIQHFFIPGTTLTIDDVILTAGGAALGYVPLGRMFGMRLHPYHLHWWQQILKRHVSSRRGAGAG